MFGYEIARPAHPSGEGQDWVIFDRRKEMAEVEATRDREQMGRAGGFQCVAREI